jgi:hypothetical protein
VLSDARHDRRLARDGFVTFPLLSATEASTLRQRYGELRGWSGNGFVPDLEVADPTYRRTVRGVIGDVVDDRLRARFAGYEPFLHNFLAKHPGPDSGLYVHRDWMYVDERRGHHTYVAWIALQDICGHNGQLRVLRGSHTLDDTVRGTDLDTGWLSHVDLIDDRLLSVPLRAGSCIVFDNRLVHASFPNHSDDVRLAAAIAMRPAAAPLVYFRRHDAATAHRFDVDEDFFCTHTPSGLMAEPPDLPVAERLAISPKVFTADELASALDRPPLARIDRRRAAWKRQRIGSRDG